MLKYSSERHQITKQYLRNKEGTTIAPRIVLLESEWVITGFDYVEARAFFGDCVVLAESLSDVDQLLSGDIVVFYQGDVEEGVLPADLVQLLRSQGINLLALDPSDRLQPGRLYIDEETGAHRAYSIQPCEDILRLISAAQSRPIPLPQPLGCAAL